MDSFPKVANIAIENWPIKEKILNIKCMVLNNIFFVIDSFVPFS